MATTKATIAAPKFLLLTATFSTLFVLGAHAQDPPSRVADLNYVAGNVSMQPAGADDWSPASINRPFTTGDNLWADVNSRAELHLNNAVLRLGPQTSMGFLNLDDHIMQIRFTQGELSLRVQRLGEDDSIEVDTPNAAVTILRDGEYRFNADPDAATTWTVVRRGQEEITGGGQAFTLRAGNSAQLSGTDQLAIDVGTAPDLDELEGWCEQRDEREAHLQTARYLPPDVIGYEELDSHGTWRDTPEYGAVWYPSVDANWAPYHDGSWSWVEPWGWTWVDDASWGFAPAHYGRWAFVGAGWGWIPGPLVVGNRGAVAVRPVYAPALVAFIGGGNWGASLSIGGPAVGWVALGPGEVYAPSYHMSESYFRTVNVSNTKVVNTVNITNVYNTVYVNKTVTNVGVNQKFANMGARNAVTAMPQNSFASGRPVKQAGVVISKNQVGQLQPANMTVAPAVAPARQALAPAAGSRPAPHPPARATSVQIVAKTAPPAPPVPFAAKQAALQQNAGRPLNMQTIRQSVPQARVAAAPAAQVKVAPPAHQVTPQVHTAPPSMPAARMPNAPGTPANRLQSPAPTQPAPANRPPAMTPTPVQPQSVPRQLPPNQPQQRPAYRPPSAQPNPPANRPETQSPPQQPQNRPPSAQPNPPANRPETQSPPQQRPEYRPPSAPPTPPANRPQTQTPPQQRPEYRPPSAPPTPPARQQLERPAEQNPPARPQAQQPPPNRPPAAQPPQNRPAPKPAEKPKKETDKDKSH